MVCPRGEVFLFYKVAVAENVQRISTVYDTLIARN